MIESRCKQNGFFEVARTDDPEAETPAYIPSVAPGDQDREPLCLGRKAATLAVVLVPFVGLVAAVALLWDFGFRWVDLALLVGMSALTGFGITVGFHRLFTHRAFETNVVVKFILAVFGSMALEAPLFQWVAQHRLHHQHSDQTEDPHSPLHHGFGLLGLLRGFWHAHIGWVFDPDAPGLEHYVKDLRQSPALRLASAMFPVWVILGLLLPAALGGLLTWSWTGALLGLLWGGLARIFLVHHVTWSVNSICHLWGGQPFATSDHSRNNFICGILAMGEGWHNNHHAFPTSARHGLRWWQIDVSYWLICILAMLGLAWKVRLPVEPSR
jgi:stearoyl-CoA desaturase (Delta-9 desaturase)